MLSHADNQDMCRVGPGTADGRPYPSVLGSGDAVR